MICYYQGFKLEAKREKCLAGYSLLFYTALRESDGWWFIDDYHDGGETVKGIISQMIHQIDDYLEHPEAYKDDEFDDIDGDWGDDDNDEED